MDALVCKKKKHFPNPNFIHLYSPGGLTFHSGIYEVFFIYQCIHGILAWSIYQFSAFDVTAPLFRGLHLARFSTEVEVQFHAFRRLKRGEKNLFILKSAYHLELIY